MSGEQGGRRVLVSDDPVRVSLSPESLKAARALLNWSRADLARALAKYGVLTAEIWLFEVWGLALDTHAALAIKRVLLEKVEFPIGAGEVGVCRKPQLGRDAALNCVEPGGRMKRRPKL